jgi:hypothetical protein
MKRLTQYSPTSSRPLTIPIQERALRRNTVPALINALRPKLPTVAEWADVSVGLTQFWQQGTYQPKPDARARLVKAVRKHAQQLLTLADAVEREGHTQHGGK